MDPLRRPDPTSQIAQERVHPGPARLAFTALALVLAVSFFAVAVAVGIEPPHPVAGEDGAAAAPGGLLYSLGLRNARLVSAAFGAVTVAAVAFAGRRLLHSDGAGILAALLLALEPSFIVDASLALPDAIALAGLATALACFLSLGPPAHWMGAAALLVAAAAQPASLLWGAPLAAMVLLRGHIYAAPGHLGTALVQGLAMPAAGALLHVLAAQGRPPGPGCLAPGHLEALLLLAVPDLGGGIVAVRNPATWLGGLGAVAALGLGAVLAMARQFRIARLPGRIQLRLAGPLPAASARALWLLALAALAPFPDAWLLVAVLGLAAGVVALAEDAPGFGVAVAFVTVAFAAVVLARAWPLVAGGADSAAGLLGFLPWTRAVACQS